MCRLSGAQSYQLTGRCASFVTSRGLSAPDGAAQTLSTPPESAASHEITDPSGDRRGSVFSGFPNRTARGTGGGGPSATEVAAARAASATERAGRSPRRRAGRGVSRSRMRRLYATVGGEDRRGTEENSGPGVQTGLRGWG